MTRIDSTKVKWRVQYRKSRTHAWRSTGLFETRANARRQAALLREGYPNNATLTWNFGLGLGNVRVVRHISGKGK